MSEEQNLPAFIKYADEFERKYDDVSIDVELLTQKQLRRCLKATLAGALYPQWITLTHSNEEKVVNGMIELEEIRMKMLMEHMILEGEIQRAKEEKNDQSKISEENSGD